MKKAILALSIPALALASIHAQVGPTVSVLRTNVTMRPIRLLVTTTTITKQAITPVTVGGKETWVTNSVVVSQSSATNAPHALEIEGGFSRAARMATNAPGAPNIRHGPHK